MIRPDKRSGVLQTLMRDVRETRLADIGVPFALAAAATALLLAAGPSTASAPSSVDNAALTLELRPFLDVVGTERQELGSLEDFTLAKTPTYEDRNPRFDLKGNEVLSLEIKGPVPSGDIIYFYHWWNKDGVALGLRDSHHMMRSEWGDTAAMDAETTERLKLGPNAPPEPVRTYTDVFTGVPARPGAAQTAFFIQQRRRHNRPPTDTFQLKLWGQKIVRSEPKETGYALRPAPLGSAAGDTLYDIALPAMSAKDVTGHGVSLRLQDVDIVFHLKSNHDLVTMTDSGERMIGSMLPQVIGYKTKGGEHRALYFAGADLIKLAFDAATSALVVDVYAYDYRERTTRSSARIPDEGLKRVHPNLGIVDKLPASRLSIMHTRTTTLAFPLWQPKGFLASFAITEHADFVSPEADRLTMYGGLDIATTGNGILGNRIPLTKTVFAIGPRVSFVSRTAASATPGKFSAATLESSPELLDMVRKYKSDGHHVEIGAHCIANGLLAAKRMTEAVDRALAMLAEFKAVTWVDHGGAECLWESGWDPSSKHYIIPTLKRYGYRYLNALGDKYDGRISIISDAEPSNFLFYSPGLDDDFGDDWKPLVFTTVPLGFGKENFTVEHVKDIVRARGIVNIHTYLPYEALQFERGDGESTKLVLQEWFNIALGNLSTANKEGDLFLATNQTLNDFIWQVRGIVYYASGSSVTVRNPGPGPINGLTFGFRDMASTQASTATVVGVKPLGRRSRDGTNYVWFDLEPEKR